MKTPVQKASGLYQWLVKINHAVIIFYLTSDLFSQGIGLNHCFFRPVFSHGRAQYVQQIFDREPAEAVLKVALIKKIKQNENINSQTYITL